MTTSIAIADDHYLMAAALSDLVQKFEEYTVLFVAENGLDMITRLQRSPILPDIVLLDLSMPKMDGFETALYLRQHYPSIRILALSMTDREDHIVRMVRNGARGYLLKECRPSELRVALNDVMTKGFYYSEFLTAQLIRNLHLPQNSTPALSFNLNNREYNFLKMACSELTYNEIADKMCVSPRTVDGYREVVFQKMNVRTRVGMVMEAIRKGLVEL